MISKIEIDLIIGCLNTVINMLISIDPNAAQNKVVIDIQAAIASLQALGI